MPIPAAANERQIYLPCGRDTKLLVEGELVAYQSPAQASLGSRLRSHRPISRSQMREPGGGGGGGRMRNELELALQRAAVRFFYYSNWPSGSRIRRMALITMIRPGTVHSSGHIERAAACERVVVS